MGRIQDDSAFTLKQSSRQDSDCIAADPVDTLTARLNTALNSSGPGYVLSLCPNTQYPITAPINFAFPQQEISTSGYPTDDSRAVLVVSGPADTHSTAVSGTCTTCSGVKLRNVQIEGSRAGAAPINGGANIEMGGPNSDQLIEHVKSSDPRSWSCLHVVEGALNCNNVTVQNNDIGPCGSDAFQQWADGISMACQNSVVRGNMVQNPTDGGIVLFGAPGTQVYNNTIWVVNQTLLGGINMVDYAPWNGNFTGTTVYNNTIIGGSSTDDVIIKLGIAIGPRTWFGARYGTNVSSSGLVLNNQFSGAFSYAIGMTSAQNFTVDGNVLLNDTSFLGSPGPNCSATVHLPSPAPFVVDLNTTIRSQMQTDFESVADGDSLICISPPTANATSSSSSSVDGNVLAARAVYVYHRGSVGDRGVARAAGGVFGIFAGLLVVAFFTRKVWRQFKVSSRY